MERARQVQPTWACSPLPGTARVDVVLPPLPGPVLAPLVERLPPEYRAVPLPDPTWSAAALAATSAAVVVLLDPSRGVDPQQLPLLAEPVVRGSVDLVLARRRPGPGGPSALSRHLGAARGRRLQARAGVLLHDPGCGALAGRREALDEVLGAVGRAGGATRGTTGAVPGALCAAGAEAGWRVTEVPVRCWRPSR